MIEANATAAKFTAEDGEPTPIHHRLFASHMHSAVRLSCFTAGNWRRRLGSWGLTIQPWGGCRPGRPTLALNCWSLRRKRFCRRADREDFGAAFDGWGLHGGGVVQPGTTHVHGWGNNDGSVIGARTAARRHGQADDHHQSIGPHPHHFEDIHYSYGASPATAYRTEQAGTCVGSDLLRLIAH